MVDMSRGNHEERGSYEREMPSHASYGVDKYVREHLTHPQQNGVDCLVILAIALLTLRGALNIPYRYDIHFHPIPVDPIVHWHRWCVQIPWRPIFAFLASFLCVFLWRVSIPERFVSELKARLLGMMTLIAVAIFFQEEES